MERVKLFHSSGNELWVDASEEVFMRHAGPLGEYTWESLDPAYGGWVNDWQRLEDARKEVLCQVCGGSGQAQNAQDSHDWFDCGECDGTGVKERSSLSQGQP